MNNAGPQRIDLNHAARLSARTDTMLSRLLLPDAVSAFVIIIGLAISVRTYSTLLIGAVTGAMFSGGISSVHTYGAPGRLCLMSITPVEKSRIVRNYLCGILTLVLLVMGAVCVLEMIVGAIKYGIAQCWRPIAEHLFNPQQAQGFLYAYLMWAAVLFLFASFTFRRKTAVHMLDSGAIALFILCCDLNVFLRAPDGVLSSVNDDIITEFNTLPNPAATLAVQAVGCGAVIAASVCSLFYSAGKKPRGTGA
ncbi:MAG: hypothetical protein QM689_09330 [Oscillospiraceae bacterium]